jgi:NAD(P)-dependent dehydrogenase (short-subunit alcohol dehydrogenase family)
MSRAVEASIRWSDAQTGRHRLADPAKVRSSNTGSPDGDDNVALDIDALLRAQFDLSGRAVVITGAGSGLGQRAAEVLAGAGAAVVLLGRRPDALERTAASVHEAGGRACVVPTDVTDPAAFARALDTARDAFGRPWMLVNNAGVSGGRRQLLDVDPGLFDTSSEVNVQNLGVYGASKAALEHMTRTMAHEWAVHGINVNAINPGYILTDLNRAVFTSPAGQAVVDTLLRRRIGEPSALDGALLLLASPVNEAMTGATLSIHDGQKFTAR